MYNRENQSNALTRKSQNNLSRSNDSDWQWRHDPWQEMQDMQRRVDQLFSRVFGQGWPALTMPSGAMSPMSAMGIAEPDIDISESESEYTLQAALPGIAPDDIDIQATEDSIRVTANSHASQPSQPQNEAPPENRKDGKGTSGDAAAAKPSPEQTTQHRQAQFSRVNRFEFAYTLPEEIRPNDVRANFRHGVLELHLPKAKPDTSRNRAVSIPITGAEPTQHLASGQKPSQEPTTTAAIPAGEHEAGTRSGDGAGAKPQAAPAPAKPAAGARAK